MATTMAPKSKNTWLVLAICSGGCAAFNGAFAKLTTTELTSSWSNSVSLGLGLSDSSRFVEVIVRAVFFVLNITFNGIMWTLFTKALVRSTSTTRVSIVNTSSNFMITALLGLMIFGEGLPPLWWLGAGLLVVGNVIIGRREEKEAESNAGELEPVLSPREESYRDDNTEGEDDDIGLCEQEVPRSEDRDRGVD